MELAAHWHRCQNLPKKRVNTFLLYRERDDPVKDGKDLLMCRLRRRRTRISSVLKAGSSQFSLTSVSQVGTPQPSRL